MRYQVEILPEAAEAIRRLDTAISRRILLRLNWLSINFEFIQPQRLTGKLRNMYKLRVAGDYRLLYSVSRTERLLIVHRVGHRRDVYKEK
ncbi:type II toxin-antitoxin system RelE/ParE family toxin [Chloroflexota bacterium]